jgi:branched-chain amino acid transport system permease protein
VYRPSVKQLSISASVLLALLFPQFGLKSYYLHIAILALINILLSLGLNVIAGYAGQLSLAQAAFFGIGSYTSALLMLNFGLAFWLAAVAGILSAMLVAVVFGLPTLRLKGPYFVIATLGFGEIVRLILLNWDRVTRGPNGLIGIPSPNPIPLGVTTLTFDSKIGMYYLILVILLVVLVLYHNFVNSKINRALRAIHDDQIAAEVMGINLTFYKIVAFAAGAGLSGLAGALYASYIRFISPDTFTISEAINILIMMVLGGMGTIVGPVIGAVGITYLLESMRFFKDYRLVIYGLAMFVMILYMPGGLVGAVKSTRERITTAWTNRKRALTKAVAARKDL